MRTFNLAAVVLVMVFMGCGPQKSEPQLIVSPSPRTINGEGETSRVRVQTIDAIGKPGTGTVHLVSTHGTLTGGTDITLENGEGTVEFGCDRATDPECTGSVKLTGTWNSVTTSSSVTVKPHVPAVGITLISDLSVIELGQTAHLVVTVTADGQPAAGKSVTLTTTAGVLKKLDGSAFASPATTTTTGQIEALLSDDGAAGTAVVTATSSGVSAQANVIINLPDGGVVVDGGFAYDPDGGYSVAWAGLTRSDGGVVNALPEGASGTVHFKVTDNQNQALPGAPVSLSLLGAPTGTLVSPSSVVSDALGEVRATLTAGSAAGTFAVRANAGIKTAQSPLVAIVPPPDVNCTADSIVLGGQATLPRAVDLIALCDGWVLAARPASNSIDLFNAFSRETAASYQLTDTPVRMVHEESTGHVFVALKTANRVMKVPLDGGAQNIITLPAAASGLEFGPPGLLFATTPAPISDFQVQFIDTATAAVVGISPTDAGSPDRLGEVLAFDPVGSQLFSLNRGISPATMKRFAFDAGQGDPSLEFVEAISPGSNGQDLVVSPEGAHVLTACGSPYNVPDLSTSSLTNPLGSFDTGPYPRSVRYTPNGATAIISNGGELEFFNATTHVQNGARVTAPCTDMYIVRSSRGGSVAFGECGGASSDNSPQPMMWAPVP